MDDLVAQRLEGRQRPRLEVVKTTREPFSQRGVGRMDDLLPELERPLHIPEQFLPLAGMLEIAQPGVELRERLADRPAQPAIRAAADERRTLHPG